MKKKFFVCVAVLLCIPAVASAQRFRLPRIDSVVCDLQCMVRKLDTLNCNILTLETRLDELNAGINLTNQKLDRLIAGIDATNAGVGGLGNGFGSLESTMKSMDEKMEVLAKLAVLVEEELLAPVDDEE